MKQVYAPTATNNNAMTEQVINLSIEPLLISELSNNNAETPAETQSIAPVQRPKLAKNITSKEIRISSQPGFVLHSYPYKETSLLIDVFSRDHGRVILVAKGAKRPHSQLRNALQTFQPLSMNWSGKSEIRTLSSAEWVGGMLPLEKSALLCGFYLNELLVKFLLRNEPYPILFDQYVSTLNQLAHNEPAPIVLRKFELGLLRASGLVGDITFCSATKKKVTKDVFYVIDPAHGVRPAQAKEKMPHVLGQTLLDMHNGEYLDTATQMQSKMLMRFLLAHHLHGIPLNTRQILIDLQKL
jgi:DNA repair protein RecO (recombination protein O)